MKKVLSRDEYTCGLPHFPSSAEQNAQVIISADKSLPRDGETVNLICSIPSFKVPATWSVSSTGVSLTVCPPSGPCQPSNDAARYTYSATASSIGVTISSFNSMQDTFGWRCQYGTNSAVYVMKPAIPVTTVKLTNTFDETLTSTINVVRGGITSIRCSTAPRGSRPLAAFNWYSRPVNQSPVLIGNQSISSTPDAVMVPGQPEPDLLISYSTLTLTGDSLYHNMYIFCEARDATSTGNYTQSGEVHLNVVYFPVVQLSPNYSVYNVTEGTQNFVFTCNIIEANPFPQSNGFSWLYKSVILQGQTSSSYTLPSVQKSHSGEYKCTARNDYGSGTSNSLTLNVHYGAEIVNLTAQDSNTVNENSTASFHCHVDGNPLPTITWTREDNNTVLMTELGVIQSQFRIESAQCLDMGNYSCTAYNGIWKPVKEILQLFVKCHPRTDFQFTRETKIYRTHYTAAILRYTVIAYPLPTFTWTFIGNGSERRDLPGSASQLDDGHQSELRITSLDVDEFGFYSVTANNSMYPSAREVFEIILAETSTHESLGMPIAGIAGGIVAGFVVILCVVIGIFLWRRYQCVKQTEHDNDIKREHDERSQTKASSPKQDAASGKMYEGLHFTEVEASQYLELNDTTQEENRNANIRPPENDSYEKLHPYTNNDIQMYSSLKIPKTSKDSDEKYENTCLG